MLLGLLATAPAYAAGQGQIVLASASPAPRFMPLAGVRNGTAGVRTVAPMRSDRVAMQNGFMRLDRARLNPVRIQRAVATPAKAPEEKVVVTRPNARPQDTAVLDLFGDSAPVAPVMTQGRVRGHAWPLPVNATQKFTSGYGVRKDPFHGHQGFHAGVDLSAPMGTPILASADGVVSKVEQGARMGKYVSVQHRDGTESSYGHMSAQTVRVGQNVHQGQKLGEVGSTGRSTGPHLHYALSKNGQGFDPMMALNAPAQTGIRVASNGQRVIR